MSHDSDGSPLPFVNLEAVEAFLDELMRPVRSRFRRRYDGIVSAGPQATDGGYMIIVRVESKRYLKRVCQRVIELAPGYNVRVIAGFDRIRAQQGK